MSGVSGVSAVLHGDAARRLVDVLEAMTTTVLAPPDVADAVRAAVASRPGGAPVRVRVSEFAPPGTLIVVPPGGGLVPL